MNICMLSRIFPSHAIGGMQDHVHALSAGLVARGHRVTVITTARADGVEFENQKGIQVHYLKGTTPGRYSSAFWSASARKLVQLHALEPFEIVHSHSIGAYGIYRAGLRRQWRLPIIASLHGTHIDVLTTSWHTDFALTRPVGAARFFAVTAQMLFNYAVRDVWFIRAANCLIATSDADPHKYKILYRMPDAKIRKVYNGIDTRLFAPGNNSQGLRRELGIENDEKVLLALARLQKDKGVQNAIAVLPRVLERYHACLVIVGDGDYRAALEAQTRALNMTEHVRFVGAQSLEMCARYFNLCDVFLDPTLRTDGYDLTIAEAMASAKPVIVSDVGANSTLVDAETGILIPRGDNDALLRGLMLIFDDPSGSAEMAARARAKILTRFSGEVMLDGIERVYHEFAGKC